jgi:hypothetical protein
VRRSTRQLSHILKPNRRGSRATRTSISPDDGDPALSSSQERATGIIDVNGLEYRPRRGTLQASLSFLGSCQLRKRSPAGEYGVSERRA